MSFKISDDLRQWLKQEAKKNEMTVSGYIKMLIVQEKNKKLEKE